MKRTVAYILSTPYAGSHYLSLMLGSHSKAIHLGEVHHLLKEDRGRQSREVEFTDEKVFAGIGPANISSVYETIASRVEPAPVLLVDNSKKVQWAERFVDRQDFARKYIHLIRDPRALIRRYGLNSTGRKVLRHRWRLFRAMPALRAKIFFVPAPRVWGYYWLWQNIRISQFVARHRADAMVATYRDLTLQPAVEIARLMKWSGLEFEPAQLEYWEFDHIGTEKKGYKWVKESKSTYFDLRWQQDLPAELQRTVSSDPLIHDYLKTVGLRMVEDGLTREAAPSKSAVGQDGGRVLQGA